MRDEDVHDFVEQVLMPRLIKEPASPIIGSFLAGIIDDGAHHGLVDLGLGEIHDWLVENPEVFSTPANERAPWWTLAVGRRSRHQSDLPAGIGVGAGTCRRSDPDQRARQALDGLLRQLATDLHENPEVQARAEALKERVLTHLVGRDHGGLAVGVRVDVFAGRARGPHEFLVRAWTPGSRRSATCCSPMTRPGGV